MAYRNGSQIVGLLGMLLRTIGCVSFALELSHWFVDHYWSWIVSAPIALVALAPAAAIQQYRWRAAKRTSDNLS